jgi:hypothetical protein
MTSKEINFMLPLEMGKTTYWWTRGPQGTPMNPDPKASPKFLLGWNQKQWANSKHLEGGKQKNKRKSYGQNIERRCQKPLGPPLISGARIHVKCLHLKPLAKKKKGKGGKAKGDAKNFDTTKGAIELNKGDEPGR